MLACTALHQFVYTSQATNALTVEELHALLHQAQTFNKAHDLTGLLFYSDAVAPNGKSIFFQILEGNELVIRNLVSRIRLDVRNTHFRVLADGPVAERTFPEWNMGFVALVPPDMERLAEYVDGRQASSLLPRAQSISPKLRELLDGLLHENVVWPKIVD